MLNDMLKRMDGGSLAVVAITFVLFALSLAINGIGHNILLEAGVFLVSVKLIMMAHKNAVHTEKMEERLDRIVDELRELRNSGRDPSRRAG